MSRLKVKLTGRRALRDRDSEALMRRAARAAFEAFGYGFDAYVYINITDDAGIREINAEQRGIDRATDVLSFPMQMFAEGETRFDAVQEADPQEDAVPLGDIVISVQRARAQAEEYGHGFERECAYLTVHSMLHLLGFDHEGEEKARMRAQEERIMTVLGLAKEG
ncbi:MAG: rRNA maturation RNase YbeY [Clostridia bacterium]|nr:rRNA maturation RNase YbeY [Clostridia bacterium]